MTLGCNASAGANRVSTKCTPPSADWHTTIGRLPSFTSVTVPAALVGQKPAAAGTSIIQQLARGCDSVIHKARAAKKCWEEYL